MTARRSNTANVFETTLSVAMAPTDLTASVTTTTGGPASPCYMVIEPDKPTTQLEIVYFDGVFGGTSFVTSGIGNRYLTGSAAASGLTHPIGSKVRCVPVSQLITDLFDYIETMQAKALLTTQADIPYATAAGIWARLAKGAAYQSLNMNPGATAPAWMASLQSLLSAKGSLAVASAANTPAELAVGTDFQHVRARAGATNGVEYASLVSQASVATSETTTSTAYTDLTTPGPAVTVTTGTTALVILSGYMDNSATPPMYGLIGFAVSGASTVAAVDTAAMQHYVRDNLEAHSGSLVVPVTGLTPGSNTFTLKYRVTAGTVRFKDRRIGVVPL